MTAPPRTKRPPPAAFTWLISGFIGAAAGFVTGLSAGHPPPAERRETNSVAAPTDGGFAVSQGHVPIAPADGRVFRLAPETVTCMSPNEVGLARTVWPRVGASSNLFKVFQGTGCIPPIPQDPSKPPLIYDLHHFEDLTWRASLDDGVTWIGGPLRVAEIRMKSEPQEIILYVAADDLAAVTPADQPADSSAEPRQTAPAQPEQ
jgi:hypothetical protein